uniref:Reverse transcriptase Ty1/copia-type domain-containing protein n=1 Tax=Fagus sylvatica TaxID=28930 RepID=A0A2N9F0L7_FAGSY
MASSSSTNTENASPTSTPIIPHSLTQVHHLITIKLTRDNYLLWKAQIVPYLKGQHLFGFLDGSRLAPLPVLTTTADGLGSEYDSLVTSVQTRADPLSIEDLYGHLLTHEIRLAHNQPAVDLSLANANFTASTNSTRGGRSGKSPAYFQSNPWSHHQPTSAPTVAEAVVCYHRFDSSYASEAHPSMQALLAIPSAPQDPNWYTDSGATHHLTADLGNLNLRADDYNGPDQIRVFKTHWYSSSLLGPAFQHLLRPVTSLLSSTEPMLQAEPVLPTAPVSTKIFSSNRLRLTASFLSKSDPIPPHGYSVSKQHHQTQKHLTDGTILYPIPRALLAAVDSSITEPTCYSTAVKISEWRTAMNLEFDALLKNKTWSLVPQSQARNLVGCKWVFRIKRKADGSIERYKARLVAKGFHQQPGIDYGETFSPVIKPTTVRTVLSIAISAGWSIRQIDIHNAFLHGTLSEDVFMSQPPGFNHPQFPSHVCKLQKAIYGLKQAPRAWFSKLSSRLLQLGFCGSLSDTSLFILKDASFTMYVLIYVDDIIITCSKATAIDDLLHQLSSDFAVKDLGKLNFFLGIEVLENPAGVILSQQRYILDILKLGALQYLSLTRPDIAFAVNKLSQFMHAPTLLHWQAVKRLLRYLKHTIQFGLHLFRSSCSDLQAYCDADWAGSRDDRRSTGSYCVFLGKNLISWGCKKQATVARSSTEAEYKALANTVAELKWLHSLFCELGVSISSPPTIWCDNIGATYLSSNPVFHARTKHVEIDFHFVRDMVANKSISVRFLCSKDQLADLLTKPISSSRFPLLRTKLNVLPIPLGLRGRVEDNAPRQLEQKCDKDKLKSC